MTDFVEGLERDLVVAARRLAEGAATASARPRVVDGPAASEDGPPARTPGRRARGPWFGGSLRTVLVALVIGGTTAGAGAAATLLTLRGSVIPAPAAQDVPREQTPVRDTERVLALRAADPQRGVPPWTMRVATGATGYVCSTVGQLSGGRFGLVGLDGRFRTLAAGASDTCGQRQQGRATLVGARVFDGRRPADVRTVLNGVAGDELRRVEIEASGRRRAVPVGEDGAFLVALRGYPEDLGLRATLTFADGHRQVEDLGRDPTLVLDPDGGSAWRAQGLGGSGDARLCASFTWARRQDRQPYSPGVCGLLTPVGSDARVQRGSFFAVRRLSGRRATDAGPSGMPWPGDWAGRPARTAVWGAVGTDVRSVTVLGAPDGPRRAALPRGLRGAPGSGVFVVVLPGEVRPRDLRVRVTTDDGRAVTTRGDQRLVDRAVPATISGRRKR